MGGIPLHSRGIVGKNRSTRSKTTVKSLKGGVPYGQERAPLLVSHSVNFFFVFTERVWHIKLFYYVLLFLFSLFISECVLTNRKNWKRGGVLECAPPFSLYFFIWFSSFLILSVMFFHRLVLHCLSMLCHYYIVPPASEANREVENLTKRKNPHTPVTE